MSHTSSAVTYTFVYTNFEPGRVFWGADEELSEGGSLWVIVYEYDGLPMLPVAPPSPDYILGPEEPQTPPAPQYEDTHEPMFIQPHDPDFMPEPIYPKYIPLKDEHILLAEEQLLPYVVSPTAESPGYVANGGDDDDGDSSGYNADDEDEDEEEEGEEHLAPADSAVVIPTDELVSPPEGTYPIIPPPSTDTTTIRARITIRPQTSISLPPEAEVERLLAMPTPSPSLLTSLSPPSVGERLARCTAPATLPSPPIPLSLYPPSLVDHRDDILESEQPPRKRLCLSTLGSRYEIGESSTRGRGVDYGFADTVEAEMRHRGIREVGYGIRDTWINPVEAVPEMAPMTLEKVNTRVTELVELHEHDTQDLYALLEDAQDDRTRISQWVAMDSQRVDLLMRDMMTLQVIVWIMKEEAYAAREAWAHSIGLSQTVHHELQTLCDMQAELLALRRQPRRARQPGGVARGEVKKLDIKLWNLKVKGNDVPTYTNRFQELTLICIKFVANENEKIDKYISGLPDSIYGNVRSSKPRTLDKTTELTNDLMDKKLRTYAERSDNKRNKVGCRPGSLPISIEGTPQFSPERPRVYSDLNFEESDWYNADIRATNILLQGLPKDIYTLINHYNGAKDIWDNVKMLLEGGLRESNYDQLFAYLKQHEAHAKENKMVLERLSQPIAQPTADPLALLSNVSNTQHGLPSLSTTSIIPLTPPRYGEAQNIVRNVNQGQARLGQARTVKCYNCNGTVHIARNCTQPKRPQNFEYFKDKMLLMHAQENGIALNAEQLLFLAGGPDNAFDDDVDEQPVQDLALDIVIRMIIARLIGLDAFAMWVWGAKSHGMSGVSKFGKNSPWGLWELTAGLRFKDLEGGQVRSLGFSYNSTQRGQCVPDCDAFDSDGDEAPTAQTMFMANLSLADPITDEVGPSYDSDILSEVQDHDQYLDDTCAYQEEHVMHNSVQLDHVVDLHANHTSVSNMILYNQYVKDNDVSVVHSNASSVLNDTFMMIYDDMCEPIAPSVSNSSQNAVVKNSLTAELATYREQVEMYERWAKFELTERKQKINEQLRLVISDRNLKEETLKRELYSTKLQLTSTISRNKSMVEETTFLKQEFKQKENKLLTDFLNMKSLKEKVEDRLVKQDQSLQTVHMLCRPRPLYNDVNKVAIGCKNPLCLTLAKQAQPALYNGHAILKNNHARDKVHNTKDTLEIAEITKKKMNAKMTDPECVTHKVKIAPHNYSKENLLATFTPQKQLTLEQIYWSNNLMKLKSKALKKQAKVSRPIKAFTVKHDAIDRKNLLIANDNLIAKCLSKEVFSVVTKSELNVARFAEMHVANTSIEARCLALEAELATLRQYWKSPPTPDKDNPDFDSVVVIGKMQASLQGKDKAIRQLKKQLSELQVTSSDTERTTKVRTTNSQLTKVTDPVTNLQAQNDLFRAENDKVKQHYKQLYDSIKITLLMRTKHALDVELIIPRLRNNRDAHLDYLRHLKESVETIYDIVKEAKVVRPLDRYIVSACRYTQHSQELLEYAIGTCPQGSQQRATYTLLIRKKQVTATKPSDRQDIGESVISRVYYVEGLGHNLFSVGQLCDSNLEVTFRKHSCYVRDTDGVDLIKGSRGSDLYTISVEDMMKSFPICLLSKASKNKSWLWHWRLNHLNFGTINDLARKDLVRGLPRLKFKKDHLCSACQLRKSKKHTHKPKAKNTNLEVLNTLHMDLCGPMRVQTVNGKKYILVIVDDYSRFTWFKFLRTKDETPDVVIKF
nr:retrovirus-related Pol polyprotein from transposon TNT 1-94 [Tanacetum cinerariifolium]